jgi:hypothetical protein
MKLIDIILGAVILALIVVLVFAITTRVPEPFTELYFENHTSLPRYASQDQFVFSIHNHENKEKEYDVHVKLESQVVNETVEDFTITIPDSTKKSFRVKYSLPENFGMGRVIVELNGTGQSIHFWTTYAQKTSEYFGKEYSADCVPTIPPGEMLVKLHGKDNPQVVVLLNGLTVMNRSINGSKYLLLPGTEGLYDFWFVNDYYNETEGIDRNLYLDYIRVNDKYATSVLVDEGSSAFDCVRTKEGNALYSNGAFRIRLQNQELTSALPSS